MDTINGKFINQEWQKQELIKTEIDTLLQETRQIKQDFVQQNREVKETNSFLKSLEQKLTLIESKKLNPVKNQLTYLEDNLRTNLVIIIAINIVTVTSLWGWFLLNKPACSLPLKSQNNPIQLTK
jgi:hypothetical protein